MSEIYGNHRVISRHTSGLGFMHVLVEDLRTGKRSYMVVPMSEGIK